MRTDARSQNSAIVAGKPTNKVERSTAEPVGPRAGGRGECEPAKHVPGAGPGKRVTGAGTAKEEGEVHCALPPSDHPFDELKEDAAAGVDGLT